MHPALIPGQIGETMRNDHAPGQAGKIMRKRFERLLAVSLVITGERSQAFLRLSGNFRGSQLPDFLCKQGIS